MPGLLEKLNRGDRKKKLSGRKILPRDGQEKQVVFKHATTQERHQQSIKTYIEETSLPELTIDNLSFSLFTEQEINSLSVCDVENVNKSYDPTFSTDDPRMGTIDHNKFCTTCGKTNRDCVGHLGKLQLPASIIHPFYRDYVIMVLETICFTCNRLLITEKGIIDNGFGHLKGRKRLACISELCRKNAIRCTNPHCGPKPIFTPESKENKERIVWYKVKIGKKEERQYMTVETIKMKLDAISDKDSTLLGFKHNHPRNFIVNFIPVIPLAARPYIIREGEKKDDYLTGAYCNILNKKIESVQQEENDKRELVYSDIIEYYRIMIEGLKNSEQSFSKGSRKEICKSIFDRITKKEGIIRKFILGKRIDYSGRTVAGPNGTLQFNYLGVPRAMNRVTIPEIATIYNIDHLNELARKGEVVYICPKSRKQAGIKLQYNINRHKIAIGDKVGRYTQEKDIVLVNRQPTLQLQSMIGQYVQFQDKGSMAVNLSSTPGMNADFDGDEINIHFLQTTDAQVEGILLMSAKATVISSGDSSPQAYMVYNSVSGAYMLTEESVIFTKEEFYEGIRSMRYVESDYIQKNLETLFERIGVSDAPDNEKYTGRNLCSVLFPPDFWYRSKPQDEDKNLVLISEGVLRSGRLVKRHVGGSQNSLVQSFVKWYGSSVTADFISAANFLFNWYVEISGLSVSLGDCVLDGLSEFREKRDEVIREMNNKLISLKSKYGEMGREEEIEKRADIVEDSSKIIMEFAKEIIPKNNNLSIMSSSGAKGKPAGTIYMVGFRGQINVGLFPPQKKLTQKKRWLTTFSVNDNTAASSGFCKYSFLEGLDPNSFYALAQEGRMQVIDRQLRTADTGYMQRRIIKAQEDLVAGYDGSIYSQTGRVVQYTYGLGFAVNRMVMDKNDEGERYFSFINTNELCGRINTENGFTSVDTTEEVVNIFNKVLKKYDYNIVVDISVDEGMEGGVDDDFTVEEEFDEANYMEDGDGDEDGDIEFEFD